MRYLARQPIFDLGIRTVGYELLFRQNSENAFNCDNPDLASKAAVDAAFLVGLDNLTGGHKLYVNCTREFLLRGYATMLPPAATVLEILETVIPDDEIVAACRQLRSAGYLIAVDDFTGDPCMAPILELTDVIKVDFRLTDERSRAAIVRDYARNGTKLLAEKVETVDEFQSAARSGFVLFQGYFFARPAMVSAREVSGSRLTYLRIMNAISKRDLKLKEIERLIKCEPALCFRLLRFLNSPIFAFEGRITSILHALTVLGEREVRKWLTITCAALAAEGKPPELVSAALVRASFCEALAGIVECSRTASFMLGLFSLMDAMLDTPMTHVLRMVSLPDGVADALCGKQGILRKLFDLVLAYEAGDWATCTRLATGLGVSEDLLADAYAKSITWMQTVSGKGC